MQLDEQKVDVVERRRRLLRQLRERAPLATFAVDLERRQLLRRGVPEQRSHLGKRIETVAQPPVPPLRSWRASRAAARASLAATRATALRARPGLLTAAGSGPSVVVGRVP